MRFLSNWRINLESVPSYVEFNQDFTEHIDYALACIILQSDDRISPESKGEFRKLVERIDPQNNTLRVKYAPRKGLGRRYADCPSPTFADGRPNPNFQKNYSALVVMPRVIKNTLFHYQGWKDYDQVKGHPTILLELARRNGEDLPAFEDYLKEGRFDEIVATLSAFYSGDSENPVNKRDIKWLFNKTIYGGGIKKWIEGVQNGNAKTNDFPKEVCDDLPNTEENLWKRKNRVMSYFCGIVENEITFQAYKYACANGMCKKRELDWGYDGFTIPPLDFDEAFHLNAMNEYVREKTGFTKVSFVRKEFDETEILQECIDLRRATVDAIPVPIVAEAVSDPEPNDQDEAYLAWKEKFEKDWCKIRNMACFMRTCYTLDGKFQKFILHTEKQLVSAYKQESYMKSGNGKSKRVSCIKEWLEDPDMRCYDDAEVYPPPLVCPPNKFNLWRPFTFEGAELTVDHPDYDAEGVQMWCDHLKILCNHEEPVIDYVVCWVAHAFQKPAVKPECMITFVSDEGAGKNIFTSSLSAILGAGKQLETTSPEKDCWGSFNSPMASAYLVVLSETDKRNTNGADGKIKAHITDSPLVNNCKRKDQYTITSYHRFICNSNGPDPTKTHKGDRRNLIIRRCSNEKKGDEHYFSTIAERFSRPNIMTVKEVNKKFR